MFLRQNPLLREVVQDVSTSPHVSQHLRLHNDASYSFPPLFLPAVANSAGEGEVLSENCTLQKVDFRSD